jgi:hypothetical protein
MTGKGRFMQFSRIFEFFASFSLLKFITDWRHENTMREQLRLEAQIEMKRIDGERRKDWIETVRLLVKEGYVSKEMSAKIVRAALTDEHSQDFQHPPGPRVTDRSQCAERLDRASIKRRSGFLN